MGIPLIGLSGIYPMGAANAPMQGAENRSFFMRRLLPALLLLCAAPAMAHDFWIDIPHYRQPGGAPVPIQFLIGDPTAVEQWDTQWHKAVSLQSIAPDGAITDHLAQLVTSKDDKPGGATLRLTGQGTHVVAFVSTTAESDLPAGEFTAYAQHEGLTPALAKREADGTSDTRGRELYSRRAKALVRMGEPTDGLVTRPIGLTLEIVPEKNPYMLAATEALPVRVFYRGKPLAGASVVLEPLHRPAKHGHPVVTDADGRAQFSFEKQGEWRLALVWTQPITHPKADFDTIFSSLTFGY